MRPLLLDLFCGAGGAARGYHDAGFRVIGVDKRPQPRYPYEFHQGDALEVLDAMVTTGYVRRFAAIHASPPCKSSTVIRHIIRPGATLTDPVNLIPATRAALERTGLPYVIENVPGADLIDPVTLCGSMFPGLFVRRHRLFELGHRKTDQPACDHRGQAARSPGFIERRYHSGRPVEYVRATIGVHGGNQGSGPGEVDRWRAAMGIDWMVRDELSQAIPPAYTSHIGWALLTHLTATT
jgi:hypothetical protein